MGIQRNDPCHCGSGKKYKKCCMKLDQAKTSLARSSQDVTQLINVQTIPYAWWKIWRNARMRSDYSFLYDLLHDEGPFKASFESREDFYTRSQTKPLPSGEEWTIQKIKLDEVEAHILSSRFQGDPRVNYVDVEMMHLKKIAEGWRLFAVDTIRKDKTSGSQTVFLAFDDFGVESADYAHQQRLDTGYERPDYGDKSPESEDDEEAPVPVTEEALDASDEGLVGIPAPDA